MYVEYTWTFDNSIWKKELYINILSTTVTLSILLENQAKHVALVQPSDELKLIEKKEWQPWVVPLFLSIYSVRKL